MEVVTHFLESTSIDAASTYQLWSDVHDHNTYILHHFTHLVHYHGGQKRANFPRSLIGPNTIAIWWLNQQHHGVRRNGVKYRNVPISRNIAET